MRDTLRKTPRAKAQPQLERETFSLPPATLRFPDGEEQEREVRHDAPAE
jgi:hypothetical protein